MKNCLEILYLLKEIVCSSFKMKGLHFPAIWRIIYSFFPPFLIILLIATIEVILENHFKFVGAETGLFIFCAVAL